MKETVYHQMIFSILRHLLSKGAGALVAWGWITADIANDLTNRAAAEITIGLIAFALSLYLSYKDKIWAFVKVKVAIKLPPTATVDQVALIAATVVNPRSFALGKESAEEEDSEGVSR